MARRGGLRGPHPIRNLFHPPVIAVERPHAFVASRLQHIGNLAEVSRAYGSLRPGTGEKYFAVRHPQAMSGKESETLTAQPDQTVRELRADARLDVRGKRHAEPPPRPRTGPRIHGA